jgi:hypothetical protein
MNIISRHGDGFFHQGLGSIRRESKTPFAEPEVTGRKTRADFIDYALFGDAHERLWQTSMIVSHEGK